MNLISPTTICEKYNNLIEYLKKPNKAIDLGLIEKLYYQYIYPILERASIIGKELDKSPEYSLLKESIYRIYEKALIYSWIYSTLFSSPIYLKKNNMLRAICKNAIDILIVKDGYEIMYRKLLKIIILLYGYQEKCSIKLIKYGNINKMVGKQYKQIFKTTSYIKDKILKICFSSGKEREIWGFWRLFSAGKEDREEIIDTAYALLINEVKEKLERESLDKIRIIGIGRGGSALAGLIIKRLRIPMCIAYFGGHIGYGLYDSILKVLPKPQKDETLILLDEVSATGYTLGLVRQIMLSLGYDQGKILPFVLLKVDPIGVKEEEIKRYNKIKESIISLFGYASNNEIKKKGMGNSFLDSLTLSRVKKPKVNVKKLEENLKKLCVINNKVCPWNIYNDPNLVAEIANYFINFIYSLEKSNKKYLLFSASIWILPVAAIVSDEINIPLVYLRETPYKIETRPNLSLIRKKPDVIIILDTVIKYGERVNFILKKLLEKKIIQKDTNVELLTLFSLSEDKKIREEILKDKRIRLNIYSIFKPYVGDKNE